MLYQANPVLDWAKKYIAGITLQTLKPPSEVILCGRNILEVIFVITIINKLMYYINILYVVFLNFNSV